MDKLFPDTDPGAYNRLISYGQSRKGLSSQNLLMDTYLHKAIAR